MPHEQEMPAPVTTTMRLLLATESERLASVRRATGSDVAAARSNVVTMRRVFVRGGKEGGRVQRVDGGIKVRGSTKMSRWAPNPVC